MIFNLVLNPSTIWCLCHLKDFESCFANESWSMMRLPNLGDLKKLTWAEWRDPGWVWAGLVSLCCLQISAENIVSSPLDDLDVACKYQLSSSWNDQYLCRSQSRVMQFPVGYNVWAQQQSSFSPSCIFSPRKFTISIKGSIYKTSLIQKSQMRFL